MHQSSIQAAPTQPRQANRLLPESLRGGRAVHGPLWASSTTKKLSCRPVGLVSEGQVNANDQRIPHSLWGGGESPCRNAVVVSGGESACHLEQVARGSTSPGRDSAATTDRGEVNRAPARPHGGMERVTIAIRNPVLGTP